MIIKFLSTKIPFTKGIPNLENQNQPLQKSTKLNSSAIKFLYFSLMGLIIQIGFNYNDLIDYKTIVIAAILISITDSKYDFILFDSQ